MARQWTVMVVSDDDTDVRQFKLSREMVRAAMGIVLLLIAGITAGLTALMMNSLEDADARLLAKNELLEEELEGLTARLDTLKGSLEGLTKQDEYYRLLAGLQPLNEDIWQLGIGGPDADSLGANPLYQVDTKNGRLAFSASMQVSALLRRARLLSFSWREAEDTLSFKQARLSSTPSIFPTRGYVSSTFSTSRWHPILDRPRPHTGIDIVAPHGTPVVASARGRIRSAGAQGEYGLMIEIDHGHGMLTRYAHLASAQVRVGQTVERGQKIGAVGSSGLAVGPHLHYEVLVNGAPANPRRYILDSAVIPD